MKKVFKKSFLFLDLPSGDILSAGFTIMGLSLLTGILGIIRNKLLATQFTPDLIGIYFAAFVLPDNITQVLLLSAAGAAFIPVFAKYQKDGTQWEFVSALFRLSIVVFLIITVLAAIFIEPLASALVPGIQKEQPAHIALFVNLTRIILFGQVIFLFSYLCTGILNAYQRFLIPASAPLLYNAGIIVGILFFVPSFGMYGVAIGIIIGALLHFLVQVPFVLKLGFSYQPSKNILHPGIGEIAHLMAPRALSIAIERIKFNVDIALASLISLASITFLNFAAQIALYPATLFAAAISQAALPFLAKAAANSDMEDFKKQTVLSLTHIAFFLGPSSALLIVLHTPLVRLIFESPLFLKEESATLITSWALAFLAIGLFAQGASNILARAFYALLDTRTPLLMTLISTVVSIAFGFFFVLGLSLPVWSLGLATTIGIILNALLLFILLDKKVGGFPRFTLGLSLAKILLISVFLGIFAYFLFKMLEPFFNTDDWGQLLIFTLILTGISGIFYLFLSFIFNLEEYQAMFSFFKKASKIRGKFFREVLQNESTTDS